MMTEIVDREPVDLTNDPPIGLDVNHTVCDHLVGPILRQSVAPRTSGIGSANMFPGDGIGAFLPRLELRLSLEIGEI